MQTYLDYLYHSKGKSTVFHWQLLSWFALESHDQIALIGRCQDWFIKERAGVNPGANYLIGMVSVFVEYGGGGHFNLWAPAEAEEISRLASNMLWQGPADTWSKDALCNHADWHQLRMLAQEILSICELWSLPRQEPYHFPDHLEIWWKDYRDLQRHK